MKISFGVFTLDLAARQLLRQGVPVPLEPKMYALLEILIQRRSTVVTNEELDELLWPKVYVARTSLTRLVSELRAVLGDTPRDSHIIRTVYKTGYVFCAAVQQSEAAPAGPPLMDLIWNGRVFPVGAGEHLAGRDAQCALVFDAVTVSRRHAKITVSSQGAVIDDLGSTNGVHVDGKRITSPTALVPGQPFSLGTEKMVLRSCQSLVKTVKVD